MRGLLLWLVAMLVVGGSALARAIPEHVEAAEPVAIEHREIIIPHTPTPAPERPDFDLYNLSIIREENESDDRIREDRGRADENDTDTTGSDQSFIGVSGSVTGVAEESNEGSEGIDQTELDTAYADNNGRTENNVGFNVDGSDGHESDMDFSGCGSEEHRTGTDNSEPGLTYLGDWTITAYCPGACCCGDYATGYTASGTLATAGRTIACNSLPFGTKLMIDGVVYTVEDTGYSPYEPWADIFFDTHEEALAWGLQTKEVYLIND